MAEVKLSKKGKETQRLHALNKLNSVQSYLHHATYAAMYKRILAGTMPTVQKHADMLKTLAKTARPSKPHNAKTAFASADKLKRSKRASPTDKHLARNM